jgi:hypothetical protein
VWRLARENRPLATVNNRRRGGELVADHPVGWGCGQLDSRWDTDENRCVPDDSGTVS